MATNDPQIPVACNNIYFFFYCLFIFKVTLKIFILLCFFHYYISSHTLFYPPPHLGNYHTIRIYFAITFHIGCRWVLVLFQVSVPHSETSLKEQPLSLSPAGGTKNDDRTMQWHIEFQDVAHVTSFHISLAKSSSMAKSMSMGHKSIIS